ncbi:phage distal tail protein [Streptomyces sichuanensis]|uniref:phage distal tail protein n=1 Tax=Streptomyces sichuanensis TaxID=2871810 RepID=UPI00355616EB
MNDLVLRTEPGAMSAAVRALAAATALRDDELPLAIKLDDGPALMCWARCLRRSVPVASGYRVGVAEGGALQFEATDPRRYSLVEQRVEARLPRPEPGLDWHLVPGPEGLGWPLDFGPPGSTGGMTVTNEGDAPAAPVIEFRGPVDRPSLTNVVSGDVVEYDIVLDTSDVLTVDTGAGTVLLNGSTSRLGTVTGRSVPESVFTLLPGTSTLAYRAAPGSSDPRSSVAVTFRSAYW